MLVDWYVEKFKQVFNFFAWVALIVDPIAAFIGCGFAFPTRYYHEFNVGAGLLGAVIGFVLVFIFELVTIPPIMVLFSINDKIGKGECSGAVANESKERNNISKPEENENALKTEEDVEVQSQAAVKSGYKLINKNGKLIAKVAGSTVDNYFCPECYAQINPASNSCHSCGKPFKSANSDNN